MHRLHRGAVRLNLGRDQLTRAAYATFAFWGWFLYGFGPAVPLLRDEEGTSRAVAGLHGTALALGAVLSAVVSLPLVRRFQRRGTLIGAITVAIVGIVVLVSVPAVPGTLVGAFLAGSGGAVVLNAINPVLSDHHGPLGAAAISEANAIAAGCGIVAPLAVGAGVALGLTWRGAVLVAVPLGALALAMLVRAPRLPALVAGPPGSPMEPLGPDRFGPGHRDDSWHPTAPTAPTAARRPLGVVFWLVFGLVFTGVAAEFCTTFWAADLLHSRDGLSTGAGSAVVSALLAGMTIGRLAGVPLSMRFSSSRIVAAAIGVSLAGWAVLWTATDATAAIVGLFVFGLGLAFIYPLGLARLMLASDGRPDSANALASLGTGLASGIAPFALGALADRVGTHDGFLLVPVVLTVGLGLLTASVAFARSERGSAAPAAGSA